MSHSVVIFNVSGKVLYQFNNKLHPFNELVLALVNESYHELKPDFFTTSAGQKRFYCYKNRKNYVALFFDVVTTIDREKIYTTLASIWKTYAKIAEEEILEEGGSAKIQKLVDFQVTQLMKYKTEDSGASTPAESKKLSRSQPDSGTSTPKKDSVINKKKMRKWNGQEIVEDTGDNSALDFSGAGNGDEVNQREIQVDKAAFERENDLYIVSELNDILNEESDNEVEDAKPTSGFFSKISSYFGNSADPATLSKDFCDHLVSKNISLPTAQKITEKISAEMKSSGQKINQQSYRNTLINELTKILTPNVSTDLLHQIKGKQGKISGRPYVISVVGVNGVGKSTNLAKLAYWLLQNNLNVLICACDTFRSGAVEQLKVHVRNLLKLVEDSQSKLKIDIFEKGYGGGDHVVATAKLAIEYASSESFDVVLIDTAGRTHSNAKLMAPLKKFGDAANPDKIIMVGEALVGTDSVEQAQNFNRAFGNKRGLDFFIISKVDTVGDLVGAMINMVMATNVPILFMGTGQTYTDIKRLNVKRVVDMLMA